MPNSKAQENAMLLDPNRQRIAKQNAVLPGGPENNNPMNVTDNQSPPISGTSIYGDYRQQYPQMGTGVVNPLQVKPSGLQQNFPMGQGQNAMAPYGMQQQPDYQRKFTCNRYDGIRADWHKTYSWLDYRQTQWVLQVLAQLWVLLTRRCLAPQVHH